MNGRGLRIGICGLGLIGSSVARALAGDHEVVGLDPDPVARATAAGLGVVATTSWDDLADCDLLLLAAPTSANSEILARLLKAGPRIATADLGSVKVPIEQVWLRDPGYPFLGTHPMAGSERAGAAAGTRDLFAGSSWPVVVSPQSDPELVELMVRLILSLGGRPVPMSAARHDDAVALASHLPHLLSGALGATAARTPLLNTVLLLAAGSFRDVSRVSGSPPQRTAEFVTANRERVAAAARDAALLLEQVAEALVRGDAPGVARWLVPGHDVRVALQSLAPTGATRHVVSDAVRLRDLMLAEQDSGRMIVGLWDGPDGIGLDLAALGVGRD